MFSMSSLVTWLFGTKRPTPRKTMAARATFNGLGRMARVLLCGLLVAGPLDATRGQASTILVKRGTVTMLDSEYAGAIATRGTVDVFTGAGATAGGVVATPVLKYVGEVNGSTAQGPAAGTLPAAIPVPGSTTLSLNFGSQPIGSPSVAQTLSFPIASDTTIGSIGILRGRATS